MPPTLHLVELVDAILEKFETDENYRSFFLDGQTIALDDYLEIRPEKRDLRQGTSVRDRSKTCRRYCAVLLRSWQGCKRTGLEGRAWY